MSSRQGALTVIAPIAADREADLRALLDRIDAEIRRGVIGAAKGAIVPFGDLPHVHFARLVILEHDPKGSAPARLLLATDFDGTLPDHLRELVSGAGRGLALVFRHCEGFPEGPASESGLRAYLENWRRDEHAAHIGARGRTVAEIRRQQRIATAAREHLGREGHRLRKPGEQKAVLEELRTHLTALGLIETHEAPPEPPRRAWNLAHDVHAAVLACALIGPPLCFAGIVAWRLALPWCVSILLAIGAGIAWLLPLYVLLRLMESRDAVLDRAYRDKARADDPFGPPEREDVDLVNEMTNVCEIKPGWLRMALCSSVLRFVDFVARHFFYKGNLAGISSIHFARWVIVREDRRLVFLSNYDGSWESYLGDFVDRAATGLTAIWSHAHGFPPTRALAFGGARYEEPFKWIVRLCQVRTQVWYRAYPMLSLQRISQNVEVHRGILATSDREPSLAWLSLL